MKSRIKSLVLVLILCVCYVPIHAQIGGVTKIRGEIPYASHWGIFDEYGWGYRLIIYKEGQMPDYTPDNQPWHQWLSFITEIEIDSHNHNYKYDPTIVYDRIGSNSFNGAGAPLIELRGNFSTIGDYAFANMPNLKVVAFYAVVQKLCNAVFYNDNNIETIICESPVPPEATSESFSGCSKDIEIIVPDRSLDLYRNADGWKDFFNIKGDGSQVTGISHIAIEDKRYLIGDSIQLEHTVHPETARNKNVRFVSDDPTIASVDDKGLIRGVSKGETIIKIVTEDGNHITQIPIKIGALSENVNLKEVKTDFKFEQAFDAGVNYYTAEVGPNVKTAKVEAIPEDDSAKVEGGYINLKEGENVLEIKVTAENGNVGMYYFLIYKISAEARIKSLQINQGTLTPAFTHNRKEYLLRITRQNLTVMLSPTPMYDKAKANIVNDVFSRDTTYNIVCIAEDGKTKETYKIKVEALSDNSALKSLSIENYKLEPEFQPSITNYDIYIPDGTGQVFIEAIPQDSNARIIGGHTGWNMMQGRECIFNVQVKAQDWFNERTYYLHVRYESIKTAIEQTEKQYEEVKVYTIDGTFLGVTEMGNGKVIIPNWLGRGVFIAKGIKYIEKFIN